MVVESIKKSFFVKLIFGLVIIIFIIRFAFIQFIGNTLEKSSKKNAVKEVVQIPVRGLIYDRNSKVMAYNEPVYDVKITPYLTPIFDTFKLAQLLKVELLVLQQAIEKAVKYSRYKPTTIVKNVSLEQFSGAQELMHMFNGISFQMKTSRRYAFNSGGHLLGYVGEISKKELIKKSNENYEPGDFIGKSGVELFYENVLRGEKGVTYYLVDAKGIVQDNYNKGKDDIQAIKGASLILTIDAELQDYTEQLLRGKSGAVVAINPATGGILAMASSPSYPINDLVSKNVMKNYPRLEKDTLAPLFNRAIMAKYAPGSTFKLVQALIALQQGKINHKTVYPCDKSLLGCHNHPRVSSLVKAIQYSCNPYFYRVFQSMLSNYRHPKSTYRARAKEANKHYKVWRKQVNAFGFNNTLAKDISFEEKGLIPKSSYYDGVYGKFRWNFFTIYSLGIGQGEILTTPLQLANLAAIVANKGHYFSPHLYINQKLEKKETGIDTNYFNPIIEGMFGAVNLKSGTARRARIKDIEVCGKTGTAENVHGQDHSIFIAFAPKSYPKIAVSVFLENAGFGGTWAAPIASLVIEQYLKKGVSNKRKEKRILEADRSNMIQK